MICTKTFILYTLELLTKNFDKIKAVKHNALNKCLPWSLGIMVHMSLLRCALFTKKGNFVRYFLEIIKILCMLHSKWHIFQQTIWYFLCFYKRTQKFTWYQNWRPWKSYLWSLFALFTASLIKCMMCDAPIHLLMLQRLMWQGYFFAISIVSHSAGFRKVDDVIICYANYQSIDVECKLSINWCWMQIVNQLMLNADWQSIDAECRLTIK